MAIEKVVRRFRIPSKNIDWALTQSKDQLGNNILTLYKNSRIPGTKLDCFTKVAQKKVFEECGTGLYGLEYRPKTILRTQFDSKGENIGGSYVSLTSRMGHKDVKISADDQSVKMSNGVLKIDNKGVRVVGDVYAPNTDEFKIQFMSDKLTPMAKRILKLLNQAINK